MAIFKKKKVTADYDRDLAEFLERYDISAQDIVKEY